MVCGIRDIVEDSRNVDHTKEEATKLAAAHDVRLSFVDLRTITEPDPPALIDDTTSEGGRTLCAVPT